MHTSPAIVYTRSYSDIDRLVATEGYARAAATSLIVMSELLHLHGKRVCAFSGTHRMVDDSYGGPESGCMAAHCTRCGYAFHHTLY